MNINWVDAVVTIVLIVSALHGWRMGGVRLTGTLISFLLVFWLSMYLAPYTGMFLEEKFAIPKLWGDVAGYLVIAVLAQLVLSDLFNRLYIKIPNIISKSLYISALGIVIGILDGIIILTFFLLIFLLLPVRGSVRRDITQSVLGSRIVDFAKKYGGDFTKTIDTLTKTTVRFLTVTPGTRDKTNLPFLPQALQFTVDQTSEEEMLRLINDERQKVNTPPLVPDVKLREVARSHSKDMFEKHYFSHIDLTGNDGALRMKKAGISFNWAGENLAYSADITFTHEGFMESQEHKRNILDPGFHRIGIGVIDGGFYGKMITQDFIN